jgi:hypothetical protein
LTTGNSKACSFSQDFTTATDFGQSRRNQMFGPNYTDTDFAVNKGFGVPGWEGAKLKVGAQFYNLFNHPNFGQPGANIASPGTLGLITSTVNTPTSILGSFLGGDASRASFSSPPSSISNHRPNNNKGRPPRRTPFLLSLWSCGLTEGRVRADQKG